MGSTETKPKRSRAKRRAQKASVQELVAALEPEPVETVAEAAPGAVASPEDPAPETAGVAADAAPDEVDLSDVLPIAADDDLSEVEGEASPRLVSIIESLLFAAERPMSVREIRKLLREPSVRQVQLALKHLTKITTDRGIVLGQVAGGFRLRTHPENARWVQKLLAGKPTRLSRSQLEALAVVAYRQPITKAEVDHVRGVDCGAVLRVLLERDLCRIVGRKEEPGRPHLYGTTVQFLEFFNLKNLRELPDLHEFRELTEESEAMLRDKLGAEPGESEVEAMGQEVLDLTEGAANASQPGPEPGPEPEPEAQAGPDAPGDSHGDADDEPESADEQQAGE